jgi:DAK2 domain fusion protein YloV
MFAAATGWLEKNAPDIDALNVFPVPDGDTGTNMLLTMRSTLEEAYRAPDRSTSVVADAIAKGALMGARGNSGVILSQIWFGLAQGLKGKETCTARDLADALSLAATVAYHGIDNPVEGTILTVAKDAATAAQTVAGERDGNLVSFMEAVVNAARDSVANTPNLLSVLKEAGVVDAGGQGLYTILEGILYYLKGDLDKMQSAKPVVITGDIPLATRTPQMVAADEVAYGYCTEFLIQGEELDPDQIRAKLKKKGESLIVVGDPSAVRVHIHTLDPGGAVRLATSLGTMHQVSIRNMDEQHEGFLQMQRERVPATGTVVVAVVSGEGLTKVFTSLGAVVVPGGQTMNPSTKDLLQAVDSVASDKAIILPNNKNIVPSARQVQSLTSKTVEVLPTHTVPQGVAAVLAFNSEGDLAANLEAMRKAQTAVKSIAITRAIRATQVSGLKIKREQPIGLLDGKLVAVGDSTTEVLGKVLTKLNLDEAEVITIYYQGDAERVEVEKFAVDFRKEHPQLQVELVQGGQPHYQYLASVE